MMAAVQRSPTAATLWALKECLVRRGDLETFAGQGSITCTLQRVRGIPAHTVPSACRTSAVLDGLQFLTALEAASCSSR